VKVKIKFAFPPHPNPLPQGERELTFSSPPLTGGDIGEGEYVNFYYSFTINRERDA